MLDAGDWSKKNEAFVLEVRDCIIESALMLGQSIIVDDTNLNPIHENHLKGLAEKYNVIFETKSFLDVPLEECIERDYLRQNSVGEKVIRKMYDQYVAPLQVDIKKLEKIYLCDIDGTLAIHNGRSPYDEQRVGEDTPNESVAETIRSLINDGYLIIFVSGRHEDCRETTHIWIQNLLNYRLFDDQLLMRRSGDNRKDSIVKRELYENNIKGKYNVIGVFDDRNQVVKMWRDLGLTCFQVAEGDF